MCSGFGANSEASIPRKRVSRDLNVGPKTQKGVGGPKNTQERPKNTQKRPNQSLKRVSEVPKKVPEVPQKRPTKAIKRPNSTQKRPKSFKRVSEVPEACECAQGSEARALGFEQF